MRRTFWGLAGILASVALLAPMVIGASYTTQIDGKPHCFVIPAGVRQYIRTQPEPLGPPSNFDLDFDNDGDADAAKIVGYGWQTSAGAGGDSAGYFAKSGGSTGFGFHFTDVSPGTSVAFGIDSKSLDDIHNSKTSNGVDAAKGDTAAYAFASSGIMYLWVWLE